MARHLRLALAGALALAAAATPTTAHAASHDYDIVYVRQPRFGDETNTTWPEVFHPARLDAGADLVLLHPDGSEEVLVEGGNGSVTDPFVSLDGEWVYYSYFYDLRPEALNYQRGDLPYAGADVFRIHLSSRTVEQLTHGEFTPNTGAGIWDESNPVDPPSGLNRLGYGILNLGAAPLAGGKIVFTSNRGGLVPPKSYTGPTLQMFVMDGDGSNVEPIAPMTIGSALHPTPLVDGRVMFSSYESQGLRDQRLWGIWYLYPDGRGWGPVVSAFRGPQAFHFMTQLSGGDIVVVDYYNLNNNGFGALYRFPATPPAGTPGFYSAFVGDNPSIDQTVGGGYSYPFRMPFTPWGMYSITPFTHGGDQAAPVGADGVTRVGKFTHPSGAPDGDLLVVWTPGPANDLNRPTPLPRYDAGIYIMPGGDAVHSPDELVLVKNDPAYNEAWPRAVVPYAAVHGVPEPAPWPWLPNDGTLHAELPAGTPYGLVGTSSFFKRESFPGYVTSYSDDFDGLDAFNTYQNGQSSNWSTQGAEAGLYDDDEIWAVRVLAMEPNTHRSYGPNHGQRFFNHANERLRVLGEIPLRKTATDGSELVDIEGNPDTSFLARIPADTPFTFQTLDRDGLVLNMAQTWHQVRPGEVRTDCGGCHAHSQQPLDFAATEAGQPGFAPVDLVHETPMLARDFQGQPSVVSVDAPLVDVEFYRDIRPILERSCAGCHTAADPNPPADLVLDDYALYDGLPGDYARLADDRRGDWGLPPMVSYGWRQTNASRYVRKFQSRRSLLMWKIMGRRLDGWTNDDHPTEAVAGDETTLPEGAGVNEADLDYTGTIMPPPGSGYPALTDQEKRTVARWIDLGCPINSGEASGAGDWGWFLDDLKPTLTVSSPRGGALDAPVRSIRIGVADANSGIDAETLSVAADFVVAGRAPGAELADLFSPVADGVFELSLSEPFAPAADAHVFAEVYDRQGNVARVERRFAVGGLPADGPDLVARWARMKVRSGRGGRFKVRARFEIENRGNVDAAGFHTAVSLSDDATLDAGDLVVEQRRSLVRSVRAGRSVRRRVSLRTDADPAGRFLVVEVDSTLVVAESDETNNVAAGVIPAARN